MELKRKLTNYVLNLDYNYSYHNLESVMAILHVQEIFRKLQNDELKEL